VYRGGTVVTIEGANLNSVAEPRIVFTTVVTYMNATNATAPLTVTRTKYSEVMLECL